MFDKILDGRGRNSSKFMRQHIKDISEAKIECIDTKYSMHISNMLQDCHYVEDEDYYRFKLNNNITKSFYYNTK